MSHIASYCGCGVCVCGGGGCVTCAHELERGGSK